MLRIEHFEHQHMQCYRQEMEGEPLEVTVKTKMCTYNGKPCKKEVRRWVGRHWLVIGDKKMDVDKSVLGDMGPKIGIAVGSEEHREVPFTEEEKAEGRKRVIEVATQLMIRAGIW